VLRIEQATLNFGDRPLLRDVDWAVRDRDRVGLVGANGAGKSTLLKVAAGQQDLDGGGVQLTRHQTVGYLPQDGIFSGEGLLLEEVKAARLDLAELQRRIAGHLAELERLDAADPRHAVVLDRLQRDQDSFQVNGGYTLEADAGRILRGLGFGADDWPRPCDSFSRGWQMRIALARNLIQAPSFLLLDEPTNHLDMESRAWLERFLDTYPGSVVVVSHDRHFLDRVVERITEVEGGDLHEYAGNFTAFEAMRAQRLQRLSAEQGKQAREITRIQQFIAKFRYDKRRAAQVQSRIRMLEKMDLVEVPRGQRQVRFRFPPAPRCGAIALRTEDLTVSYGALQVLDGVELEVARAERVAVVGPNGAGKSTLLRLIAGRQRPDRGFAEPGHNVVPAYFAQDQLEEMDGERTVMEELLATVPQASDERLRGVLGAFLFQGEEVDKRVGVLSGGERNRLALAKILVQGANLLLLDEPTNHLDMQSKDVLLDALRSFGGTVIFVSHDRHFVDGLADAVLEVGGGGAMLHRVGFDDFLWGKARELGFEDARVPGVPAPDLWLLGGTPPGGGPAPEAEEEPRSTAGEDYKQRVRRQRAEERRTREVARIMARIEQLEGEIGAFHAEMERPEVATDYERVGELQKEVQQREAEAAELYERWEELQE